MPKGTIKTRFRAHYKKVILVLVILIILIPAGFWVYVQLRTYSAQADYLQKIKTDPEVAIIESNNYFLLKPAQIDPEKMPLVYYPGGLVAPEAYLYKMGRVALELQKTVYVIRAPFNAAIFDIEAAGRIIESYDLGQAWVGGHSLGGITACRFTENNPEKVYGLFLFGSYCDKDLGTFEGPVVSLMGTEDKIINRDNYEAAKDNLPPGVEIIEVEGLNHSDFGNYGLQGGDGRSSLDNDQIIALITSLFQ